MRFVGGNRTKAPVDAFGGAKAPQKGETRGRKTLSVLPVSGSFGFESVSVRGGEQNARAIPAIQRLIRSQSTADSEPVEGPALASSLDAALGSTAQPLDARTRLHFENRIGHDFRHVRIHADSVAAESAAALNSNAYTAGADIVFGEGKFAPETDEGRELLAHELVHVKQQGSSTGSPVDAAAGDELAISEPADPSERQAEEIASRTAKPSPGLTNPVETGSGGESMAARPGATIHRDTDDESDPSGGGDGGGGGGVLGALKTFAGPALEAAGALIPGVGAITDPVGAALDGGEVATGESTFDKVKGALGFGTGVASTAAGMGGFELAGAEGAGSMALGALPGAAAAGELGTLGMAGPLAAVAGAGLAGVGIGQGIEKYTGLGSKMGDLAYNTFGGGAAPWLDDHLPSWMK